MRSFIWLINVCTTENSRTQPAFSTRDLRDFLMADGSSLLIVRRQKGPAIHTAYLHAVVQVHRTAKPNHLNSRGVAYDIFLHRTETSGGHLNTVNTCNSNTTENEYLTKTTGLYRMKGSREGESVRETPWSKKASTSLLERRPSLELTCHLKPRTFWKEANQR